MLTLLEYVVAIGGSLVLFFITKALNLGVHHFTVYLCLLLVWSIVMYAVLHLIYKVKNKRPPQGEDG